MDAGRGVCGRSLMRAWKAAGRTRLRIVVDGRLIDGASGRVDGRAAWVDAAPIACRWGARLDIGEEVLGWRDARTGRTVVFRRGSRQAELDGQRTVSLSAAPDWSDGALHFPADAVALAGGASVRVDRQAGVLFITRPDPYLSTFRLVIDPGHGGNDPGCSYGDGLVEKHLNLDVARRLARLLKASGASVALTRSADVELSVAQRCARARQFQAQLVVSLHHNAFPDTALQGAEGYFYRTEQSRQLAAALVSALAHRLGIPNRGVREANVGVLRCLSCPAALVEAAFVSEPRLARAFSHPWMRVKEAMALLEGLRAFCGTARSDGTLWLSPAP